MSERLAFGFGTSGQRGEAPSRPGPDITFNPAHAQPAAPPIVPTQDGPDFEPAGSVSHARRDWAFVALMVFTGLLYFRPQTEFRALAMFRLAELSAIAGLLALTIGRLSRGRPFTRITPELLGVAALGGIILVMAPLSIWMGGVVATFTNLYAKVLLIFLLMVNTLDSPKRIRQFTWLIVVATAYIAFRAVFDYARGINLIENGRVRGAVGGMFANPNDLALNLVAVLPLSIALAIASKGVFLRLLAAGAALLMVGAIVASHSRSGTVGLACMVLLLAAMFVRRRPGLVFGGALVLAMALPLAPASYWQRLSSITDGSQDDTGSREARRVLLREAWAAFVANPLTGVGAGQFRNYAPEGGEESWRETHNVLLQVASELGLFGLLVFSFLIVRGLTAGRETRRLLRQATGHVPRRRGPPAPAAAPVISPEEARYLETHATAMTASMAGWFVCALFASVAYNWTFYYLLALAVAPRDVLMDRLAAAVPRRMRQAVPVAVREARA